MLEQAASTMPEGLDAMSREERNRLYRMLRLEITPTEDGTYEVRGAFRTGELLSVWATINAYLVARRYNERYELR